MKTYHIPAPVGGWNASQALDNMAPTDAVKLINWIPRETSIEMRKGSKKITDSALGGPVETLVTYRDESGDEILIAGYDGKVSKISTTTGVATELAIGFTNNQWQTININNLLVMCNGADTPQEYNGTALSDMAITGATAADLIGITTFKGRAIYWEKKAAKFWYADAGAYTGALTAFPLEYTTQKGGYVMDCMTWTRDSGDGVDDLFVIIMSTGETLVYSGSDPGSATDWSLIGKFTLGRPLTVRGSANLAADRIIITEDGFVNLSTALQVARVSEKGNVSSKIVEAVQEATNRWGSKYGWEIIYHARESLLIVNIPRQTSESKPEDNVYNQYCMNTNTGAWTMFRGWQAITFTEVAGDLFMGSSDGHIRKCFYEANDDTVAISTVVIPAFSTYGVPDRMKQATYVTVTTSCVNKENIGLGALADFNTRAFGGASVPTPITGTQGTWNASEWNEAYWSRSASGDNDIHNYNLPVKALGYSLSFKMNIQSDMQIPKVYSFRQRFKMAGAV